MKKFNLILAVVAVLMFTNLTFGANPKKNANQIATVMIEKMSADIVLTDSQKVAIKATALELATKVQNANSKSDKTERKTLKKQAFQTFNAVLDSTLTSDQKNLLKTKANERHTNSINQVQNK
jgi:hypothetical protein